MTPEEIINTITERVKDTANVKVVFGDPIESGGVTVIPVASVKVAGGGGGGKGRSANLTIEGAELPEGSMGMGLQITTKPLGYIEITGDTAKLVPIVDVTKIALVSMITGGLVLLTFGRLLFKMARHKGMKAHWSGAER